MKDRVPSGGISVAARSRNGERRKIAFIINSLCGGGAERIISVLLTGMAEVLAPYDVHLILLDRQPDQHTVPPWVTKHVLDCRGSMQKSIIRVLGSLRRLSPAVSVSFLNRANCANIVASTLLGRPCVISERVNTSSHFGSGVKARMNKAVVRFLYPRATQVVAVSRGVKTELSRTFGVPEDRVAAIYNPISIDHVERLSRQPAGYDLPERYIVGVGRLASNKNFSLAVRSLARSHSSDVLVLLGEGDQRQQIEAAVRQLGLEGRVLLLGHVANPYPIMAGAQFLILPSNAEGFPNVLVEAMALGCPVIATDCASGPAEILGHVEPGGVQRMVHAESGILVPMNSEVEMAAAIDNLSQPRVREFYSERGRARAAEFTVKASVDGYWRVIREFVSASTWPTECGPE